MMRWRKLVALDEQPLFRGTVFRFEAVAPKPSIVDYMVIDCSQGAMSIIQLTGYHSGQLLVNLPSESNFGTFSAISSSWLQKNWNKWVYSETPIEGIWVNIGQRPDPRGIPMDKSLRRP